MNVREKALLMIESVEKALANGCRHYDPETGELLHDVRSILTCLAKKKTVTVQEPDVSVAQAASDLVDQEGPRGATPPYVLDEVNRVIQTGRVLATRHLTDQCVARLMEFVGSCAKDGRDVVVDLAETEVLVAGWCRILGALHARASAAGGRLVLRGARDVVKTALGVAAPGIPFVFEKKE